MTGNRDRIILAPLRSSTWGKAALMGAYPLPPRFEPVADLVSGSYNKGVVLRHSQTGEYVLWIGHGAIKTLPGHKVVAALTAMQNKP